MSWIFKFQGRRRGFRIHDGLTCLIGEDAAHKAAPSANLLLSSAGSRRFRKLPFKDVGYLIQDELRSVQLTINSWAFLGLTFAWPSETQAVWITCSDPRWRGPLSAFPSGTRGTRYTISSKFSA